LRYGKIPHATVYIPHWVDREFPKVPVHQWVLSLEMGEIEQQQLIDIEAFPKMKRPQYPGGLRPCLLLPALTGLTRVSPQKLISGLVILRIFESSKGSCGLLCRGKIEKPRNMNRKLCLRGFQ
jgi:hypothetical protein